MYVSNIYSILEDFIFFFSKIRQNQLCRNGKQAQIEKYKCTSRQKVKRGKIGNKQTSRT